MTFTAGFIAGAVVAAVSIAWLLWYTFKPTNRWKE